MTSDAHLVAHFDREGGRDVAKVTRRDGSTVSWSTPSYGGALPHDAVHLVIESAFGLRLGLFGLVDRGADPGAVNREVALARRADRRPTGFGHDLDELLTAEALCAVHWYDPALGPARRRDIAARCADFGAPLPDSSALQKLGRVVVVMRALRADFRARGERGLVLRYRPSDPRRGLHALVRRLAG